MTVGPPTRIGELVDDHYRIVEHLADGGMASVYRAEHVNTGVSFAVKILHPDLSANAEVATRFQREVQAYRRVQHPHVVVACDFGRLPDGCLYMVLEFTPGSDLCVVLHREGPFAQERALKIALQVALGLIAAHAAGVVHRDLKPENVMLIARPDDPDFAKILDFGIAKMPVRGQQLTVAGSVFGTPDYMAPEQASGGAIDERTDLYTLGIVLYEMLAGRAPFADRSNASQVILAQLTEPPPPLPAAIDPELVQLVQQLLAKDPIHRPQRAIDVASAFHRILARLAPQHPGLQSPTVSRFVNSPSRRPPPTEPDVPALGTVGSEFPPEAPVVPIAPAPPPLVSVPPMATSALPPGAAPPPGPAARVSGLVVIAALALLLLVGAVAGGLVVAVLW